MAKFKEKIKAQQLRKKGWSIRSIEKVLGVSRGSVSSWCIDIKLTDKQKSLLKKNAIKAGNKGRMIGAKMNHQKKLDKISFYEKEGLKAINNISKKDLLMVGLGLYWGEGVKSDKSALAFVNSDPDSIVFMKRWFEVIFKIKEEEFMPRIFINEIHRPRIKKVLKFWSNLLELPIEQFGNPVFLKIKQKKVYENYDNYFGVLSLKIRKSTYLKYKVLGLLKALKMST
ncbi:hypothetical protein KKH36_00305 [Patescibacteria group bacterium]|nr:hypothetical protein [Patescibacteria group bacterium]